MNTTDSAADRNVCNSSFPLKSSLFMLLLSGTEVVCWRCLIPRVKLWLASTIWGGRGLKKKNNLVWVHLLLQGSPEATAGLCSSHMSRDNSLRHSESGGCCLTLSSGEEEDLSLLGLQLSSHQCSSCCTLCSWTKARTGGVLGLTWIESSALGSALWMFPSNLCKDGVRDSCWSQVCFWRNI